MCSAQQSRELSRRSMFSRLHRALRVTGWIAATTASLLAFPSVLPWMMLAWILFALGRLFFSSANVAPHLLACSLICVIKLPELTLAFAAMVAVLVCSAFFVVQTHPLKWKLTIALLLVGVWAAYWWSFTNGNTRSRPLTLDQRPIVCLGDSLTDFGYPDVLRELIVVPVEDFGFNGINTADALKLVPDILAANAQLVVVELGGHDYNQGHSRQAARKNLASLIEDFHAEGIEVVLMEIPRGFVTDPFFGLERELSREYDLQLIPDSVIREFVLFSPIWPPGTWLSEDFHLSRDGLHPNSRGNRRFAQRVARTLEELYGTAVMVEH